MTVGAFGGREAEEAFEPPGLRIRNAVTAVIDESELVFKAFLRYETHPFAHSAVTDVPSLDLSLVLRG